MSFYDDHGIRENENQEYCAFLAESIIGYRNETQLPSAEDCWLSQIGPCVVMIEECQEGTGLCYTRLKVWQVIWFGNEGSGCRPLLDVEWSGGPILVNAYHAGDWERKLLGSIGACKPPLAGSPPPFINAHELVSF